MHAYLFLKVTSVVASKWKASYWRVFFLLASVSVCGLKEVFFPELHTLLPRGFREKTKTNGEPKWRQILKNCKQFAFFLNRKNFSQKLSK